MTDPTEQMVADAIFTEALLAFYEVVDKDDMDARVTSLLSMHAPRLAKAAVEALGLTEEQDDPRLWDGKKVCGNKNSSCHPVGCG